MDVVVDGLMQRFRHDRHLPPPTGNPGEREKLFELFASYCLIRKHCEAEFEPADVRTGGQYDLEIDGAAVLVGGRLYTDPDLLKDALEQLGTIDAHFIIVQAKTEPNFKAATFALLASNLKKVFDTGTPVQLSHNGEIARFRQCIEIVYNASAKFSLTSPRISVYYAALGNPSQALDAQRTAAVDELKKTARFAPNQVEMFAIGSDELELLYRRTRDPIRVSFKLTKSVPIPEMPGVEQAHIGVVSAIEFVDKVVTDSSKRVRHSVFYDNVRGFLGSRNQVNAGIKDTLDDDVKRGRFAVMNNGITIVTRELKIVGDEFLLKDFHVVNGCQTCYSLAYARPNLDPQTNLTVRIVETHDPQAIADIVEATNKQTHVASTDFDARSPFHKTLESYFAAQTTPKTLLYERRAGQFGIGRLSDESMPLAAHPGVFVKRDRIVDRATLARTFASVFLGEAWRASRQAVMPERTIFKATTDPAPFYTAASLWYRLDQQFRTSAIPGVFANAKYHLLAAAKCRLVGDGKLPGSKDARASMCEKILDLVWDDQLVGPFFDGLTGILLTARDAEQPHSTVFDGALVRSKDFADRVRFLASEQHAKG